MLAVGLILAGPSGCFVQIWSSWGHPIFILLSLPVTISFVFDGLGHLIGSQISKDYNAAGDLSEVVQFLIAMALVSLAIWQITA